MNTEFLKIIEENSLGFQKIADKLFNEFVIKSQESKYQLLELEFYWHSENHQDKSTYNRNHVQPERGDWFFHYSGVDIALKDENGGYGGILIRKIKQLESNKIYSGPMVCAMRIFSEISAFNESSMPRLIAHKHLRTEIISATRIGLGKNSEINDMKEKSYRFIAEY